MVTRLAAREFTLPPRMFPNSGPAPSGISTRFVSYDALRRNLEQMPVAIDGDRQFHSSSATGYRLVLVAAPLARQIVPRPLATGRQYGTRFQVSSQVLPENSAVNFAPSEFEEYVAALLAAYREIELPAIVREFAAGVDGVRPGRSVVDKADRLVQAALQGTAEPEFAVDVDGALSFDLRLSNGLLLLAELSIAGNLDASVYDDAAGERVQRLPRATEAQFMELLR